MHYSKGNSTKERKSVLDNTPMSMTSITPIYGDTSSGIALIGDLPKCKANAKVEANAQIWSRAF